MSKLGIKRRFIMKLDVEIKSHYGIKHTYIIDLYYRSLIEEITSRKCLSATDIANFRELDIHFVLVNVD